jgi:flavin reductase (DIM6/NTAB) family NADH-FMN oxidoreductase RutF
MKDFSPILTINPRDIGTVGLQNYLQSSVGPRPIALASTVDAEGNVNLSPFSFFNVFSANPPILIFSPARRVRDNTSKHTLDNVLEVPETVINVVNYSIVQQTSLASTEYEKGVNEFVKAGLTEEKSVMVKPPRVSESPVAFECAVREVIHLGDEGGAGNLVLCEVLLIHINRNILNEKNLIDQRKIDLVARMGGDWYCRASGAALFEVEKPLAKKGIGFDGLPQAIRESYVLTGNHLAQLANSERIPTEEDLANIEIAGEIEHAHFLAKTLLDAGKVAEAWKVLLSKK